MLIYANGLSAAEVSLCPLIQSIFGLGVKKSVQKDDLEVVLDAGNTRECEITLAYAKTFLVRTSHSIPGVGRGTLPGSNVPKQEAPAGSAHP